MYDTSTPYTQEQLINRNRLYIRSFLGSPLLITGFIVLLISLVLNLLVSLIQMGIAFTTIIESINTLIENNTDGPHMGFSAKMDLPINNILLLVSILVMYKSSCKPKKTSAPTTGVTIFWIWTILALVSDIGSALACLLIPLILSLMMWIIASVGVDLMAQFGIENVADNILYIILLLVFVVLVVYATLYIVRGINRFRFGLSMRNSVTSETLSSKGAVPYAVTNLLISAVLILSSLFMLWLSYNYDLKSILSEIEYTSPIAEIPFDTVFLFAAMSSILTSLLPIFMSIFALKYHSHICAAGTNGENLPVPPVAYAPEAARSIAEEAAKEPASNETEAGSVDTESTKLTSDDTLKAQESVTENPYT